jgi:predicted outer membrane protein
LKDHGHPNSIRGDVIMRTRFLAVALLLLSTSALAQLREAVEVPPGMLAPADVDFLRTADTANIDQMTFGNRMAGNVKSRMRTVGENVSRAHHKADEALRLLAAAKHVDLDHRMSDRAKVEADELMRPDPAVDRMYAENVVRDMDDLIALYEGAATSSADGDIRAYADEMLPALNDNKRQAADALARAGEPLRQ